MTNDLVMVGIGLLAVLAVIVAMALAWRALKAGSTEGLQGRLEVYEQVQERRERQLREDLARGREEASRQASQLREETGRALEHASTTLVAAVGNISNAQTYQLDAFAHQLSSLTESTLARLDEMRTAVDRRLQSMQEDNAQKLEQMRQTVDEKLQGTLERRLGDSFKLVSDRLEQVHRGLGEMQTLASGVGDLKRMLTNVKARGTWGEMQLDNLLQQMLGPEQYARNVATRENSAERVEFAVKLPGPDDGTGEHVWLPIDSKFPQEDYLRLVEAAERGDAEAVDLAGRQLEARIKVCAREVRDKYLNPPRTTDFGLMFLPTEGLYAEILRRPGLVEQLQREYRVSVCGPTTLAALLTSLQMGFRTLAIQRRSSEVWKLLALVKRDFEKFGEVLDKVQTKLQQASATIEKAASRSRSIQRRLQSVEEMPAEGPALLKEVDAQLALPDLAETPAGPQDR